MKKRLSNLCIALIIALSIIPSFASNNLLYQDEAKVLYELNLYKGISEVSYEPDLESNLTREQSAVILARLFGNQDEIEKMNSLVVKRTLLKFVDANNISDWAKKEVAYGVKQGYIKGIEKEDGFYFNPQGELKGIDYASLILQQLGITDFNYQGALQKLVDEGIITNAQKLSFDKQQLIRDDVVGISYNVLKAKKDGDTTVIENLINLGKVEKDTALKYGLIEQQEPIIEPEPTQQPIIEPIETQQPVIEPEPTQAPVINPIQTEGPTLYRADGAIKLGQWTLSNGSREPINVNKIYLSATYGGLVSSLKPAYVTDYSIEDVNGNVYAVFSSISSAECIDLGKPFVISEMVDNNVSEKDICVYAKINDNATYGGTIELFLGDGTNIFEATGAITGTSLTKTGAKIAQKDGKKTIAVSKILPKLTSYDKTVFPGEQRQVASFKLENTGSRGILIEKVTLKELTNSTGNSTYTLKNEQMETIANATSTGGEIVFNIATGQRISANDSETFSVIMDDDVVAGKSVRLKLLKEGTSYDTVKNEGYVIDIDDDLLLDEVSFRN